MVWFSYGVQYPYDAYATSGTPITANAARPSDPNGCPGLVLFADRAPQGLNGTTIVTGPVGKSTGGAAVIAPSNHAIDGEVIIRRDYSVAMYKSLTNSKAGFQSDDIYVCQDVAGDNGLTNSTSIQQTPPKTSTDTFIMPFKSR
jgi:hypothetical protein